MAEIKMVEESFEDNIIKNASRKLLSALSRKVSALSQSDLVLQCTDTCGSSGAKQNLIKALSRTMSNNNDKNDENDEIKQLKIFAANEVLAEIIPHSPERNSNSDLIIIQSQLQKAVDSQLADIAIATSPLHIQGFSVTQFLLALPEPVLKDLQDKLQLHGACSHSEIVSLITELKAKCGYQVCRQLDQLNARFNYLLNPTTPLRTNLLMIMKDEEFDEKFFERFHPLTQASVKQTGGTLRKVLLKPGVYQINRLGKIQTRNGKKAWTEIGNGTNTVLIIKIEL